MTSDLTSWVSARLDADAKLSDDAKLLILAALEGKTALADITGYTPPATIAEASEEVEPVGAFLKQIKVRGFRGIGPESQLDLPFPSDFGMTADPRNALDIHRARLARRSGRWSIDSRRSSRLP